MASPEYSAFAARVVALIVVGRAKFLSNLDLHASPNLGGFIVATALRAFRESSDEAESGSAVQLDQSSCDPVHRALLAHGR
jgi:hypothetical protein